MLVDVAIGEQPLGAYAGGTNVSYPSPFLGAGRLVIGNTVLKANISVNLPGHGSLFALSVGGGVAAPPLPRWTLGAPEMRYMWTVHVGLASLIWFRCTHGQCGVDPHLIIGTALDLECMINRFKPAHTEVIFDYSSLEAGGPMAGTP